MRFAKTHTYPATLSRVDTLYSLYQKSLSRFFFGCQPILTHLVQKFRSPQTHDVFFWLVCQGDEEMARTVWPKCNLPVHVALLGAAICKKMGAELAQPASRHALERGEKELRRAAEVAHGRGLPVLLLRGEGRVERLERPLREILADVNLWAIDSVLVDQHASGAPLGQLYRDDFALKPATIERAPYHTLQPRDHQEEVRVVLGRLVCHRKQPRHRPSSELRAENKLLLHRVDHRVLATNELYWAVVGLLWLRLDDRRLAGWLWVDDRRLAVCLRAAGARHGVGLRVRVQAIFSKQSAKQRTKEKTSKRRGHLLGV